MITAVALIAGLRFGKELVIPLTLAVLLSFLLAYPANWLERLRLGHVFSVAVVLIVTLSAAGSMIWIGTQQLAEILIRLPQYQENIQRKLQTVRSPAGSGLAKVAESINQLTVDLSAGSSAAKKAQNGAASETDSAPIPVRIVSGKASIFGSIGGSVLHFFATGIATAILTLFLLLRRGDIRNRLFRLFGQGRINTMTTAFDDAARRVSRYLLTQSLVNCTFGLLLGLGLFVIGVPYAAFWGVAGAALRFIPYLGTWTAGICPFILSLAVFEGWLRPLLALGWFGAVELTMSGIVEPWLYATRTGISSLAILLSAAFWTILWGPIGLMVSTPLTVLLYVLGRHIPQLEFLYILLGDQPVLSPAAYYYQRLLALDEDEAREVAEKFLKEKTVLELYDSVLIPALFLAEQDRHQNELDEERQKFISDITRDLIEEFGESDNNGAGEAGAEAQPGSSFSVLCIPARDEADELVGLMLAQVLRRAGYAVETLAVGFLEEMLARVEKCEPKLLFISALPPFAIRHARSLCRRAHHRCPGLKVVIGLWASTIEPRLLQQRLGQDCANYVVHNLAEAELQLRLLGEQLHADVKDEPDGRASVGPREPQHA